MNTLNILYFSVHEILEYDDLTMFTSRGHKVFSLGRFSDPSSGPFLYRDPKPSFFQADFLARFQKEGLTSDFLDLFDVILVNHDIDFISQNAGILKGRLLIYRTIGQSVPWLEQALAYLDPAPLIVRYSESERGLPAFANTNAVIYFGKDLEQYPRWAGGGDVRTFHNNFEARSSISIPDPMSFSEITRGIPSRLFGSGNETIKTWGGFVSFPEMIELYRTCACYLYVWSNPPSYTLSLVEAILVGAPIVAPSAAFVESHLNDHDKGWYPKRYEVPMLLNDPDALLYDTIEQARLFIMSTMEEPRNAAEMAERVREKCAKLFDMNVVGQQWDDFFASHC